MLIKENVRLYKISELYKFLDYLFKFSEQHRQHNITIIQDENYVNCFSTGIEGMLHIIKFNKPFTIEWEDDGDYLGVQFKHFLEQTTKKSNITIENETYQFNGGM